MRTMVVQSFWQIGRRFRKSLVQTTMHNELQELGTDGRDDKETEDRGTQSVLQQHIEKSDLA